MIEPQPKGDSQWRMNGLDTLVYDGTNAVFANSEKYRVSVAASVTSNSEEILGKDFFFEFSTPAIKCKQCIPSNETVPLCPVFIATFDQVRKK